MRTLNDQTIEKCETIKNSGYSLYPTVQDYQKYPVGHPTEIFNPEKYDKSWYGLIKCKMLPPKRLYHPVLPQRIKVDNCEKLIFTLFKACTEGTKMSANTLLTKDHL